MTTAKTLSEITSTSTVESKFRLRRFQVMIAEAQKLSPVMAAKFVVNFVKNSTACSIDSRHACRKIVRAPGWPCSAFALFIKLRTSRTNATTSPAKHMVPNEGPSACLPKRKKKAEVRELYPLLQMRITKKLHHQHICCTR